MYRSTRCSRRNKPLRSPDLVSSDWAVSTAIVNAVDVPVVLAAGLSPTNVAAAVVCRVPLGS